MSSSICTLFEGDYHYGVAALVNSLYVSGFKGTIYAGYRGDLPKWAKHSTEIKLPDWTSAKQLSIADELSIVFLRTEVDHHLANYKPDFMLALIQGAAVDSNSIFYFDPDIVVTECWQYFEEWVSCGVAVCEDAASPLPVSNPRRHGWRIYYRNFGNELREKTDAYVNSGFIGVATSQTDFLRTWMELTKYMGLFLGGLDVTLVAGGKYPKDKGFANCFEIADQDSLNASIEAYDGRISIAGIEAMAFKGGHAVIPHSTGAKKPWRSNYVVNALRGIAPTTSHKAFWNFANGLLQPYTRRQLVIKKTDLKIGSMIGRFYRRS